jgi:hypothetical protein
MNPRLSKKHSVRRVAFGVGVGFALLVGVIWLLIARLGNTAPDLYAGKQLTYWQEQLNGNDTRRSNEAFTVVKSQVIPQLLDRMFHDTNDSRLRIFLVETLDGLPGVQIYFTQADTRRMNAAQSIGELGPVAQSAVPALLQALRGKDAAVHGAVIEALGKIHSEPQVVIPLLIGYLEDEHLNDEAALALANYGSLAKAAVPKIVPMLHAQDKDARYAATKALRQIDPEAYQSATNSKQGP